LYKKWGSYYGRWRTSDGRLLNRKVGPARTPGERDGLTRTQAEREFRRMQEAEEHTPRPTRRDEAPTVEQASESLRSKLELAGARRSYLQNCESMQRVHVAPRLGKMALKEVTTADVEALAGSMLRAGRSPKTVRNVLRYLHSIFEHAIDLGWTTENPVRRATRPGRRRQGDADPDLQFLTLEQLEAVLREIPDEIVVRVPASTRNGRRGPAPPPPPDVLGPVLRAYSFSRRR
jgi:hypothetical protein